MKSGLTGFLVLVASFLPFAGFPEIVISEIMAKNGKCLATKSGCEGIDWIELHNTGSEAVDVSGWFIGNDPGKKPSKWSAIEGDCLIPAGGYAVVWCDGDGICTRWDASEAHVACNISSDAGKHTLFLATERSEASIVQSYTLPKSFEDVSIAVGRAPATLVGERAEAEYKIGGGSYRPVSGSLGMTAKDGGLQVVSYKINKGDIRDPEKRHSIWEIDVAKDCIDYPACWKTAPVTNVVDKIAFRGSTSITKDEGAFSGQYTAFPGISATTNFVMDITGALHVPSAGDWTFAIGCNDGFECVISRFGETIAQSSVTGEHSYNKKGSSPAVPDMAMRVCSLEAGVYEFRLVYYDCEGGCVLDCSAAQGRFTNFNTSDFKLIGDPGCPIAFSESFGAQIANDVKGEMLGKFRELAWRKTFNVDSEEARNSCRLRLRYADGFEARINGSVFASAAATDARSVSDTLTWSEHAIPASMLAIGDNTLTVVGKNDALDDGEFFLHPTVVCEEGALDWVYYPNPTPGSGNSSEVRTSVTPAVVLSEPHGYKARAFDLAMSCPLDPARPIYYTLNGEKPVPGSANTKLYSAPITISRTTVVRAAAADPNSIFQDDASGTYLFLDDIVAQSSSTPAGFPGDKKVNGQYMRYGMNSAVTGDASAMAHLKIGFTNGIRTASIVMDPKDLFDSSKGIYVNALRSGREWERHALLEQIYPLDTNDEFHASCGIRIRGATSRNKDFPKHGFHMVFRDEYGAGLLQHSLFGKEGAKQFKRIDFRCEQNNAWVNLRTANETMLNDVFSRDSQRDMGQPYNRSHYYHLFINGIYWGVYQTEERVDQNYAADYMGGDKDNYDVVRTSNDQSYSEVADRYTTGVVEGETDAWRRLHEYTLQGYSGAYEGNYNLVRGLNPDGTRNHSYPVYLDVTNLVCYLLTSHFTADGDTPANGYGMANNIIAFRNRVEGDAASEGFKWNRHDSEHSLARRGFCDGYIAGAHYLRRGSFDYGETGSGYLTESQRKDIGNFNPNALHCALMKNKEYRRTFADLVQKFMLTAGGAMTAPACLERHARRKAQIVDAVAGELARWGQGNTYDSWLSNCEQEVEFINKRISQLMSNYRGLHWMPAYTSAPLIVDAGGTALTNGTKMAAGQLVYINKASGTGTIYYTTDGSDPWATGNYASGDGAPWKTGGSVYTGATAKAYAGGIEVPRGGMVVKARFYDTSYKEWSTLSEIRIDVDAGKTVVAGDCRERYVISADGEYVLSNANFSAGIAVADGVSAKLVAARGTLNTVDSIDAPGADLRFSGEGAVRLEGADTLVTVRNLVVESGVFQVKSTGVSATKTAVINVLGYVEQKGGVIDLDIDVATANQIYGIYVANKDEASRPVHAEFAAGEFRARIGGTKSSALYVNKGSVDTVFKGGERIEATIDGMEARFVNASGEIKFKHCEATVTNVVLSAWTGVRVFKSDKDIDITSDDARFVVDVTGAADAEIFSSGDTIRIEGGVFDLAASDDCFSALNRVMINGGLVYARSTSNDVVDSNGDIEINGGTVLAYSATAGHAAFDVDPESTAESEYPHQLRINGGTVFAAGSENSSWPADLSASGTCFVKSSVTPGGPYFAMASASGSEYVVRLPDFLAGGFAVLATCPECTSCRFSETAPSQDDHYFRDLYVRKGQDVPPVVQWDVAGARGGISGIDDGKGGKTVSFSSVRIENGRIVVDFAAGRVDANGETVGLVCKRSLLDKATFIVNATVKDDGSGTAVVGALEAQTDEPQLFILGIGQAAK